MMILFTALLGVCLLSVTGVVFMRPVAQFLGATPEMLEDCVRYGRIVIAFTAAFMLQNVFQSFSDRGGKAESWVLPRRSRRA